MKVEAESSKMPCGHVDYPHCRLWVGMMKWLIGSSVNCTSKQYVDGSKVKDENVKVDQQKVMLSMFISRHTHNTRMVGSQSPSPLLRARFASLLLAFNSDRVWKGKGFNRNTSSLAVSKDEKKKGDDG